MSKRTLMVVGTNQGIARVLPSVSSMLGDAQAALAAEMETLATLRGSDDPELASTLTKNCLGRADALLKLLKVAQLLRIEKAEAERTDKVGGKELSSMTDEEIRALLLAETAEE